MALPLASFVIKILKLSLLNCGKQPYGTEGTYPDVSSSLAPKCDLASFRRFAVYVDKSVSSTREMNSKAANCKSVNIHNELIVARIFIEKRNVFDVIHVLYIILYSAQAM